MSDLANTNTEQTIDDALLRELLETEATAVGGGENVPAWGR